MSVTDGLVIAVIVLYFALAALSARQRRQDHEAERSAVRLAVLEGRVALLNRAARQLRDRDPEKTQKMSAYELARAKRGKGPPSGH